ncbi:integrase [Vibrio parahaemolyticus]|uniref:tyrosine-type recombinase/integrase n=1 Tax=Vibrio parahaemolyticus TaxID=670 RepID=UPI000541B53E|nr:site-specific integrase [Vibrio parahaemolyticus]ELU8562334.1 tyrosine-type recombinase/integrase [Vibrio parahaemolyticus]KHF18226.1 integrase [Vibrio parahaemolyticus]OTV98577.1 integrase [Vibrio parahaemolyticus]OTW04654.1 integrase [Vibrio parahaemolyticus]
MAESKNSKPLTNRAIETLTTKKGVVADVGENRGLRIACGKTGRKTFTYRFRSPENEGKITQIKLGVFPELSLEQARIKLREFKAMRDAGICPKAELDRIEEERRKSEQKGSVKQIRVKDIVDLYLEQYIEDRVNTIGKGISGARKPKGQKEVRRTLYVDVVDVVGNCSVSNFKKNDVVSLIQGIIDRGAPVQAGSVIRELSSAYDFAISMDFLPEDFVNPALHALNTFKMRKVKLTCSKGKRVLDHSELIKVLHWLPTSGFTDNQKGILKLTLWTGCRTGELCGLKWEQIDFDKGTIFLEETKNGNSRYVQLVSQALVWLKQWQHTRLPSKSPLVFPLRSDWKRRHVVQKQLSENMWRMRQNNTMLSIPQWTAHDLRRTVRTELARLGCPTSVAEAVLGHSPKGIEGTYNLHRYENECREWLQLWANFLDSLVCSGNDMLKLSRVG